MNKLSISKFIIITNIIFLITHTASASSLLIKKEPYSIVKETQYKKNLNIALLPLKGEVDLERTYLKDLIKSLIKDAVLSYKKYRMPDRIIDYKRNPFDISTGAGNPADDAPETGFMSPQFIDERQIEKLNTEMEKTGSVNSNNADIIISGEINQMEDDITVTLEVNNNIYGKTFVIKAKGNIKNIEKFNDDIFTDIIKSIIIDYACLDITSVQKGAMIYADGRYLGKTDRFNMILEAGYHEIKIVKDGFQEKTTVLILKKDESKSMEIDLDQKSMPGANIVHITTAPEKAKIYIDSAFVGYSPVKIENLADGDYRLRVDLAGYISRFQTLEINNKKLDINISLEKGSNKDYYFTRTPVYNYFFKGSLFGCASGALSFIYFGMKIEDEKAKIRGFEYADTSNHTSSEDAEYARLKKNTDARISKFLLYRNISAYSVIGLFISAGIFYYLDISQYDIDIAIYNPDLFIPQCYNSHDTICSNWQDFGVRFSLRF